MDELGLSIPQLADKAGMDYHVLYQAHRYKYLLSDKNLEKISGPLDVDAGKLVELRGIDYEDRKYWEHLNKKNSRKRRQKTVICRLCLEPGQTTNAGMTKYPHEECKKLAKRIIHNGNVIEESALLTQFTSINQNRILLESKKKRKKRICLKCERLFSSRGPHNRICDYCKWYDSKINTVEPLYRPHKVHAYG